MNGTYQIPSFHFRVLFNGLENVTEADTKFQSVSGIKVNLQNEPVNNSMRGEKNIIANTFEPVILRRGLADPKDSALLRWLFKCVNDGIYEPIPEVRIEILNEDHSPTIVVKLFQATPRSWSLGELHAERSEVLIEELTLDYQSIQLISSASE